MAKRRFSGFAFDPPSHEILPTPTGARGLGDYYAGLGMNKWEVNKRIKERGMDGTNTAKLVTDSHAQGRQKYAPDKGPQAFNKLVTG